MRYRLTNGMHSTKHILNAFDRKNESPLYVCYRLAVSLPTFYTSYLVKREKEKTETTWKKNGRVNLIEYAFDNLRFSAG